VGQRVIAHREHAALPGTETAMIDNLHPDECIYRYEVPVDDQWHELKLWGNPQAVNCRDPRVVEFWCRHPVANALVDFDIARSFIVIGTGHRVPVDARYWGTAIAPGGQLVWHLLEAKFGVPEVTGR
jgi:hypothetical protein